MALNYSGGFSETAAEAARALAAIEAPTLALSRRLEDLLDEEADELAIGDRARIEGALRGLDRRVRMTLPAWRSPARPAMRWAVRATQPTVGRIQISLRVPTRPSGRR